MSRWPCTGCMQSLLYNAQLHASRFRGHMTVISLPVAVSWVVFARLMCLSTLLLLDRMHVRSELNMTLTNGPCCAIMLLLQTRSLRA